MFSSPIEYKNTFWDYLLFHSIQQFFSPVLQGLFIVLASWTFMDVLTLDESSVVLPLILGLFVYAALWILNVLFLAVYLLTTKRKTILTAHTISLGEDGLHEETPFNRTVHFWNGGIVKVVRWPNVIGVFVTALSAHIIPVRAFRTDAEANEFVSAIRERMRTD